MNFVSDLWIVCFKQISRYVISVFIRILCTVLPTFFREKKGCTLFMGNANSISILMFLILVFMLTY